jgi:dTDP-4-dehydrorhamnose reductase
VSLLTRFEGAYEPGAWDVRSTPPRRTALADLIEELAHGRLPAPDSCLRLPGWWQRESRLLHSASRTRDTSARASIPMQIGRPLRQPRVRPTLIAGATGTLGRVLARACEQRGLPHRLVSRQEMDITDSTSVDRMLNQCDPSAVINAAGYVRVDDAERDQHRCERENAVGARTLADACAIRDVSFVTFSSDLVFDGLSDKPYVETDPTNPLSVYGETKARAERLVLERHPAALVIRTSAFFGPWDDYNFLTVTLRALSRGETVHAANDLNVSPTFVPDLAHATLDLLFDHEQGLWHLANRGNTSWFGFARQAAAMAGVPVGRLVAVPHSEFAWQARRPMYSVLGSARGDLMPTLESALTRYVTEAAYRLPLAIAAPREPACAA